MITHFKSLENCFKEKENCRQSESNSKKFVEDCKLNYRKIAFLCVPYCYNEIDTETVLKIKKNQNYCFTDYVSLGMPFYDI